MENNFEELIATLPLSASFTVGLGEITNILDKQNIDLLPSFILQSYSSLFTLECWAWKVLSKDSNEWANQPNYLTLFQTLALFNKNVIFNFETIENDTKALLLIPETINQINGLFDQINRSSDDNNPFIGIASVWFDNLSYFIHENPQYDISPVICHINQYIARNYIMTDQFKFYLIQLQQAKLLQSIFTTKQIFYIKTCSFSLSTYLTAKPQNFPFTAKQLMHQFGNDYVQIIAVHSHIIEIWSGQLLTCITHLTGFTSACCWWGGEKLPDIKLFFPTEEIIFSYIDALIRIISYQPFYNRITAKYSNDETMLLDFSLFSVKNAVHTQDLIWFFRSKNSLPDTLLTIAEVSIHDRICLRAYVILGEILCNERLRDLKITDNVCFFFFDILEHAWHHPSKKYKQVPILYLLRGFLTLSKIDAIQQKTADLNRIPLLIDISSQYSITFDILWALSFNQDIQKQLCSNTAFMSKLVHLSADCNNEQTRKMTHGILWNLESNHKDRPTSEFNNEKPFDIMISYSHKDEILCKQIYQELTKASYRVWIDFDQIHGNVMDAMAQAIERSHIIIICMSEEYRRSNYCRAEAHYAFQCQLRIVPILLQEHYQPDGWLLFLIGQLLYVDFTKNEFSQAMELLTKEIKVEDSSEIYITPLRSRQGTNADLSNISVLVKSLIFPKNIQEWTKTNVHDWLLGHNLVQMSHLLVNCDGRGLIYLNNFIKNGETKQVLNLLHEDSLRRIGQSLSLLELSYFQSLIDHQKRRVKATNRNNKYRLSCCSTM